ncbi:hypothetical protein ACLESD_28555, partial [Pyxidicoccus sp. 3LFB2]
SVLSPERLRALVIPAPRPLVAVDVSNALYETRSGRPLFFVRGEAENRTGAATRIRVRAALYDGDQRVRSAEALVGAVPTPEELYARGQLGVGRGPDPAPGRGGHLRGRPARRRPSSSCSTSTRRTSAASGWR